MAESSVDELIDRIRLLASTHGYAIGVHGSLDRDLDLIAVPWVRQTSPADELATAVAQSVGSSVQQRRQRLHGRIGYVVRLPGRERPSYIDLSVMGPHA